MVLFSISKKAYAILTLQAKHHSGNTEVCICQLSYAGEKKQTFKNTQPIDRWQIEGKYSCSAQE